MTEAEEALNIDYVLSSSLLDGRESTTPNSTTGRHSKTFIHPTSNLSPIFSCSPNAKLMETVPGNKVGDTINEFLSCFKSNMMSTRLKTQLMQHLLELFIGQTEGPNVAEFVESDFITTIVKGMRSLFDRKKENLIYHLSKCFEGPVPRMPLDRMPFGLIDYNIRFFSSNNTVNVRMEEQYAKWLETMFAQFGHKWLCLHRGPAWQYEPVAFKKPVTATVTSGKKQDLIQEALEQSSLDLSSFSHSAESEECSDLNTDMCNLSVSDGVFLSEDVSEEHSGCNVSYL